MDARIEQILWKINYKLDVLLEGTQEGLSSKVREDMKNILYPPTKDDG